MHHIETIELADLQQRILSWFTGHARSFPWRGTSNPFFILIAEKLLQQTAAGDIVVNSYNLLTQEFPTAAALASAEDARLEAIIRPLGLTYRARELKKLAAEICTRHEGNVPRSYTELLALPGVGEYIARAVLCFGFGEGISIVDVNVARVLYRVFQIGESLPSNPARNKPLIRLADTLIPRENTKSFNLAILDLAATTCLARNPKCSTCPAELICQWANHRSEKVHHAT